MSDQQLSGVKRQGQFSGALSQLAKHSSVYALGMLLSRVTSFLLLPFYTSYLSPFDYGVLEIVETTSGMIGLVAGFGLAAALGRFYFDFEDEKNRNVVMSTTLMLAAFSAAMMLLVSVPLAKPLVRLLFGSSIPSSILVLTLVTVAVGFVVDIGNIYMRLNNRSAIFVTLSLANLLIGVGLNVYFIAVLHLGVLGIVYSNLITRVVVGVPLLVWVVRQVGVRFDRKLAHKMYKYGAPMMPSEIASVAIGYSDRYFINGFLSTADAGIYGMAQKLGTALHYLITSPFLTAFITQRFAIGRAVDGGRVLASAFKYHMIALIVPSAIMSLFAFEILNVMTTREYHAAASFLPMAALAMVVLASKYHFEYGILREKMTKYHMYINISSALLQVVLNLILIKWIGLWGAMLAGLAAYATKSACYFLVSRRLFYVPYPLSKISSLLVISCGIVAASMVAFPSGWSWSGIFGKSLLVLLVLAMPFMLGLLNRIDVDRCVAVVRSRLGLVSGTLSG